MRTKTLKRVVLVLLTIGLVGVSIIAKNAMDKQVELYAEPEYCGGGEVMYVSGSDIISDMIFENFPQYNGDGNRDKGGELVEEEIPTDYSIRSTPIVKEFSLPPVFPNITVPPSIVPPSLPPGTIPPFINPPTGIPPIVTFPPGVPPSVLPPPKEPNPPGCVKPPKVPPVVPPTTPPTPVSEPSTVLLILIGVVIMLIVLRK